MRLRTLTIRNLGSPYGMTLAAVSIFLFAYFFPPSLYVHYMEEPDYLFLDPTTLLFFLLCTLAFVAGLIVIGQSFQVPGFAQTKRTASFSPMWFILLPVIAGTVFTAFSVIVLIRDNANLLELLLAAQGNELKAEGAMQVSGPISQASPLLMGIVWWAIWRKREFALSSRQKIAVNSSIAVAFVALISSSTLMVTRGELMPIFAGIAIVVLVLRIKEGRLTSRFVFSFALAFGGSILMLFVAFSLLRGLSNPTFLIPNILGYTISSYNRLAAMLAGILRYPFAGKGIYISAFLAFNRSFNHVIPLNSFLEWPDFVSVWRSEFDAVSAAGLDGRLIWSGTFGYLFADLGWFTPLILFVYGIATGWAWRLLQLGKTAGVVIYPWCAFCVLFWFGTNYLLDPKLADLLIVVVALNYYESWFSSARTEATQE